MQVKTLLRQLDFGNSVAEFDESLEDYFVETDIFHDLVHDKVDIVSGDKGTGKTAIYRYLQRRYTHISALDDVELIPAFNPSGNPIFQRLTELEVLKEQQYIAIWKAYFLTLTGNWLLQLTAGNYGEQTSQLETLFDEFGFRNADDSPKGTFTSLLNWVKKRLALRSAGVEIKIDPLGSMIVKPSIEFGNIDTTQRSDENVISYDEALALLDSALKENELTLWILLDRLDEAFVGYPEIEMPALRALFRVYLDFQVYSQFKLKLFVRNDLFRKISSGGFVNLTHVNAKKRELIWDEDDLFSLLCQRIRRNTDFLSSLNLTSASDQELFSVIFPPQVDRGKRKPSSWKWILSRIRDGNGVMPPRNLVDLANKAKAEQLRKELRHSRSYEEGVYLIEADSLKQALSRLSKERLEDTLLAESSKEIAALINGFRDGKVEHNDQSIADLFGVDIQMAKRFANILIEIGFLEEVGKNYKIPMLYRDGLGVTQGKAFH